MTPKKKKVYESLRFRIVRNELRPGQMLNEKELIATYEIGRTPLREVLLQLQRDKLIQMIPRLGTLVANLDLQDIKEIVILRRSLEGLAGELATAHMAPDQIEHIKTILERVERISQSPPVDYQAMTQADLDIHACIYAATHNQRLQDLLMEYLNLMARFWYHLNVAGSQFALEFLDLKQAAQGLEERDASKVRQALEHHVDRFITNVKKDIL